MKELTLAEDSKSASLFDGRPEEGDIDDSGDSIKGTDRDDSIFATTGNKSIFGKKGKDYIKGSRGKDKIYGGKDDDICDGDDDDDEVKGDRGKDKVYGGKGKDKVYGGKDDDKVSGGKDKDYVSGDEGNDVCMGDEGDDTVSGGAGDDTVIGGKGNDTCMGDDGDDSISGGEGDDSVVGGEGKDTIIGGAGKDTCMGDDGDDSISGGADDDTLIGGAGNDVCMGDEGDDSVVGGGGDDTVMGGAGKDTLVAGDGNDMVDGGDGDDSVVGGGSGDDTLMGSGGNDTIVGGTGNHTCTGGAGDDVFVISDRNSGPNSVITDFTENDKFLVSGSLNFSSLSFVQVGVNTEIRGSSNFVLALLLNVNASILKASSFLGITAPTPTPVKTNVTPPTVIPINTPPKVEANNSVILGSGKTQTITSSDLKFTDLEQSASLIIFTLTELPPATTGKLLLKGVEVTQVGLTFSQADINAGSLTFQAVAGFTGAANFGFTVTDGKTTILGQKFSLNIVQTVFNFAGNTAPQVIVGSALDDDIKGGDGGDDIKGGKGKDKIKGGKGKNKIKSEEGDDDIEAGDGGDDIEGGIGNDKVIGGAGNDTLTGNEGDDEIEGGEGKNTLSGGAGKNRFVYKKSREGVIKVEDADLITDFKVDDDLLDFSNAAFGISVASLTRLEITATSVFGSIGSNNLLDFSADITVRSIATLQARFKALGGDSERPTFCQFTDEATGRMVLVFAVGVRFEVVASFSVKFSLKVSNFVFTGPPLNLPVGTSGPDNVNFGTSPVGIKFDGLAGNDNIIGSNFSDSINGGDGDDTITGGGGADILTGGSGADIFAYTTTKEGGDKISDFKSGTDKFQFVTSAFGNLTTTNFDGVSGSAPDITGKELVIFTGGTYANVEAAQLKATGSSTTPGFFVFTNAANETVLVFDSNGTLPGGSTTVANFGTAPVSLGTADFVFTGPLGSVTPPPAASSTVNLITNPGTFPATGIYNFGSGAGGYNFTTPVLFTGNSTANNVTGTDFADIINGGSGADIFDGGAGNDSLFGGPGNDTLNGGVGNDTLIGGLGTNVLNGGAGLDVFVFTGTSTGGGDLITNYSIADDVINLDKTGFAALTTGAGLLGSSFYKYSSTVSVSVTTVELSLTGPSIMAIFDGLSTKLYYDSNGSTPGGSNLFATVDVNLGVSGNSELFLF